VERFINDNFIPVKIHIREQPAVFERFGAQWTPTFVIFDSRGQERRRFEGFLPAEDLLGQLELALAHVEVAEKRWAEAERSFRRIVEKYASTDAAPEALYWAGVSRYKAGDASALAETERLFRQKYPDSTWAKKASVWRKPDSQGQAA